MKKKIKKWIDIIGKKNMIAISALVLVIIVVGVVFAVKNNSKNNEEQALQEESVGLQVQENADDVEGDSIDFSEFLSEGEKEEDKKEDTKKDETSGNNSGLNVDDNADDSKGNNIDFNEEPKKEDNPKLDVKLEGESKKGYIIKEDSDFAHIKDQAVKDVIKTLQKGDEPTLSDSIQTKLGDKKPASKVYDIKPEEGQEKDKDGYYIVDLTVKDLSKNYKNVVVLHYSEERTEWEVIEPTKVDGDIITVKFKDLSPVVIYGEPIEEDKENDTPGTGEGSGDNEGTQGGTQGGSGSGTSGADFGPLF